MPRKKIRLNSFQIIIFAFVVLILLGAVLLLLPISSKSREVTPFNQSLFTSVSAVCVTGLAVVDTATHWSVFGQVVILLLIQIGGLGVMTALGSLSILFGRKMSLSQQNTLQESTSSQKRGDIVRLTIFIIVSSLVTELIGAIAMMPRFIIDFGGKGVWLAVFHSVSAFCNAGFDIMPGEYTSLTAYAGALDINIVTMLLIVIGGIGFLTLDDVRKSKWRVKRYRLQTKIILITSTVLIFVPSIYFFVAEFNNLPIDKRILGALFQSVTTRTAGFNTLDVSAMSSVGKTITIVLMLIGGSPGSTAGGMKTTTVAVLFANAFSVFRKEKDSHMLRRCIDGQTVKTANAILLMYLTLFIIGAIIISIADNMPMSDCMFETASAIGTVGLTVGITPSLGILSQMVLISLMFIGRVGGLTLIYATITVANKNISKLPQESITVG